MARLVINDKHAPKLTQLQVKLCANNQSAAAAYLIDKYIDRAIQDLDAIGNVSTPHHHQGTPPVVVNHQSIDFTNPIEF
jgi:hypothetical protein